MTNDLPETDRASLLHSIGTSLGSLQGDPDERHYLIDVLGFVGGQIHIAKAAAEIRLLKAQVQLLSQDVATMQKLRVVR